MHNTNKKKFYHTGHIDYMDVMMPLGLVNHLHVQKREVNQIRNELIHYLGLLEWLHVQGHQQ